VLLCKAGSQAGVTANMTCEDWLFMQVCSDPTPMHCNTIQGKMHSPVLNAALQKRLTAGLFHCKLTNEDLLFRGVSSDSATVHCNTVQGKMQSQRPVLLCKADT